MSKTSEVKNENGDTTHFRVTKDDASTSYLYEADSGFLGLSKGKLVEVAEHKPDGTTVAYEPHWSIISGPIPGSRK